MYHPRIVYRIHCTKKQGIRIFFFFRSNCTLPNPSLPPILSLFFSNIISTTPHYHRTSFHNRHPYLYLSINPWSLLLRTIPLMNSTFHTVLPSFGSENSIPWISFFTENTFVFPYTPTSIQIRIGTTYNSVNCLSVLVVRHRTHPDFGSPTQLLGLNAQQSKINHRFLFPH